MKTSEKVYILFYDIMMFIKLQSKAGINSHTPQNRFETTCLLFNI